MGSAVRTPEVRPTLAGARALARVWALRAQSERVQERRFGRLSGALAAVGAEPAVVGMARQAEKDERFHKGLCAGLAKSFGWEGDPLAGDGEDVQASWPSDMPPSDRVLYEVVASCCLMETLNASLLAAMHASARVGKVKRLVRRILKDEVRHSRLGWAHLAAEQKRRDCGSLAEILPKMLEDTVREELFSPPPPQPSDLELIAHGELPLSARLVNFKDTLADVVFPGFESLAIDTAPARRWLSGKLR